MSENQKDPKKISRRGFLKETGLIAGGVALAGCTANVATTEAPAAEPTAAPVVEATAAPTSAAPAEPCPTQAAAAEVMDSQMAAKKWSFEIAPDPIPDSDIANTVQADIIVVGAGLAGLVAANAAAENGAKVVLFSASAAPCFRGGSNHCVNSRVMEAAGVEPYDPTYFFRKQLTAASYNVDQNKWWRFYNNSEEAMNWLIDKMEAAGFETVIECSNYEANDGPSNVPSASHSFISQDMRKAGMGAQFEVETLASTAEASGVQIIYKMVAKQLVREDNNTGRVSAVIAQGEDGTYTRFEGSKGIILATGDFSADVEMMSKYCPTFAPLIDMTGDQGYDNNFRFGGVYKGDGHKMGLWIGAAWQKTYPNAPMILGFSGIPSYQPYGGHQGLLINLNGQRYMNEDCGGAYSAMAQMHQPERKAFAIWGTNLAGDTPAWYEFGMIHGEAPIPAETMIENWEAAVKAGTMVKGDTIEAVIEQLGLPADETKATVDRYNELCANGKDTDFYKRADLLVPIKDGPFYGGSPVISYLTVMGGLRTDLSMRVCDENDQPIPGLYNVGVMIGDMNANCYNFMIEGHSLGCNCITYGYLTGRDLAKGII